MSRKSSRPAPQTAPWRHTARVGLLHLLATLTLLAAEPLSLTVSTETAPAGGTVQIKIRAAEPRRITTGWLTIRLDPQYFSDVRNVTGYSATGDAMGYASPWRPESGGIGIRLDSPSGGMGQLPDLPILTITATLKPGIPRGTTIPIPIDERQTSSSPFSTAVVRWLDADGAPYETTSTPGSITIGGTLSVTEARATAPDRLTITGTGFDPATAVTLDGVAIRTTSVISPERIELTLAGTAELTGRRLVIRNSAEETAYFYISLPTRPASSTTPEPHVWTPLVPRRSGGGGSTTIRATQVLQNPGNTPVVVTWQSRDGGRQPTFGRTTIPPGEQLRIAPAEVDPVTFQASAPVRAVIYNVFYRPAALRDWVTVPTPATSLPALEIRSLSPSSLEWNAQRGARDLPPSTLYISGGGKVRITRPASATWLTVDPATEILDLATRTSVEVRASTQGLAPGTYTAEITVTPVPPADFPDAPVKPQTATARLTITDGPRLVVSGLGVFSPVPAPSPQILVISTTGDPVRFTLRIEDAPWLNTPITEGTTPASIMLTATPGALPVGTHEGRVIVSTATETVTTLVRLQIVPPTRPLGVSTSTVTLSGIVGQPVPERQFILFSQQPGLQARVEYTDGANWLTATPFTEGPLTGVRVRANATSLTAGTWRASLHLSAPGFTDAAVDVTLTLMPAASANPGLQAFPATLSAALAAGTSVTQPVRFTSAQGTEYLAITPTSALATLFFNTTDFVDDEQRTPRYPTPVTAIARFTFATPGLYFGSFDIRGFNSQVRLPWAATVTASESSPPTLATVVNAASQRPTPLVPNSIYTLHGLGIGALPNTELRIDGEPVRLGYNSPNQINFTTPASLRENTTARLELRNTNFPTITWDLPTTTAAPGIFTINGTGVGTPTGLGANPTPGANVGIFVTGLGRTPPDSARITIGGKQAALTRTNSAEGYALLSVAIPTDLPSGTHALTLTVGRETSQPAVTVTVP